MSEAQRRSTGGGISQVAAVVGLPLAAAGLILAGALVPSAQPDAPGTATAQIGQATYACPAGSSVTMSNGQLNPGTARDLRATPEGEVDEEVADATRWSTSRVDADGVIVTQLGDESGAVGFWAGEASANGGGGLIVGRCGEIVDEAWFLGMGTADRQTSTLVLSNMSDTPAVADLTVWGPDGPVEAVGGTGLVVEPYQVLRYRFADFAAGQADLALQVSRQRGQLSAMVYDGSLASNGGSEAIGKTAAPATSQFIPGLDGPADGRTLLLLNPGDQAARVNVTSLTADGPLADDGLQDLLLEAGTYTEIEIPEAAGEGQQALEITSDRPVAASVRLQPESDDFAIAEATQPLQGAAIVPVAVGGGAEAPVLTLTAVSQNATVNVTAFDEQMQEIGRTNISVTGQTTVTAETGDMDVDGDIAYLVVSSQAEVVAAATYANDDLVASLLLEPATTSIQVPTVFPRS